MALRPTSNQRGYDARWQQTRTNYLACYTLCSHCFPKCVLATEVHHKDGRGPLGPKGHDWSNLEGLCKPCHSRETIKRKPRSRPSLRHPGLLDTVKDRR